MPSDRTRKWRSEREWRQLVRRQASSGLSVAGWCEKYRLAKSAFYRWRARCSQPQAASRQTAFVPVRVVPEESSGIEILLAGGRRIRLCGPVDRRQLAEVLAVLEGAAC